jgi:hypothetical protein
MKHLIISGLLFVLTTVACVGDLPSSQQPPAPKGTSLSQNSGSGGDQCPNEEETINGIFDADGCPDTIETLLDLTVKDIDTFWRTSFEAQHWTYRAPDVIQGYTPRQSIFTGCGRTIPNNAFYCFLDNGIYYDVNFLQRQVLGQEQHGDFGVVTVLAHEWGHQIQGQLGLNDHEAYSINIELQADCFAGAYGQYVSEGKSAAFRLEEGDLDEGATLLFNLGDVGVPWFDPEAHGSQEQRYKAFALGLDKGLSACYDGFQSDTPAAPQTNNEPDLQQQITDFWIATTQAEIKTYQQNDISYIAELVSPEVATMIQETLDSLNKQGIQQESYFDSVNSYIAAMRQTDSETIELDTCEFWTAQYYSQQSGELVQEEPSTLVPQTLTLDLSQAKWQVKNVEFYEDEAFCKK